LSDYKEPEAIKECTEFHEFMRSKNDGVTGLFFIMVRDDESPHFRWDLLSDNDDDNKSPTIYLIKANQCFLDAGESFMGDFHREKEFIKGVILEYKNCSTN
jgi:hypothetical protein